ncbi:pyrimidine reductase family protein [Mycetocola sp. 2940]|uniref:pyrimidine reductase family protein n=1 Tax=Mycetocola sp. 2940 TaxID=3156452 RepID=UPI003398C011
MTEPGVSLLGTGASLSDDEITDLYAVDDRTVGWLRVNFVSSVDGAGTHDGLSGGLGTPADKRVFDLLRRLCDVVLVGAGTVRAEGYGPMRLDDAAVRWRQAHGLPAHPVFAIVSARLNLDPFHPLFADAPVRPIVVTVGSAPEERRKALAGVADVLIAGDDHVDPGRMRSLLADRGLAQVHSEGGPHLFADFLRADAVDEVCLTISPVLEGPGAGRIVGGQPTGIQRPMALAHVLSSEATLLLRYVRDRS